MWLQKVILEFEGGFVTERGEIGRKQNKTLIKVLNFGGNKNKTRIIFCQFKKVSYFCIENQTKN